MSHVARTTPAALLSALLFSLAASTASAGEAPAVREANFRVIGDYTWLHYFSEEAYQFRPGPTELVDIQQVDIDDGGFTGIYVAPLAALGDEFGVRAFAGPRFSKTHVDVADETETYGVTMGGDVFWRDPAVGEAGLGTFYAWDESETGSIDRSNHEAGLVAFGKAFFGTPGEGLPVDLDVTVSFSDADIDSSGANSANRTYSADGGVRAYLNDNAAVRLGGLWSRTNLGPTDHVEDRFATIDVEVLLPTERNVILGGGFIVGDRNESFIEFQKYGRFVFGITLNATVSFTGAESLAELRRNFF
ncbi:MAG: hypothetical protein NXI30_01150 [bacterium]|nr:hypothetical protein [bacterium]